MWLGGAAHTIQGRKKSKKKIARMGRAWPCKTQFAPEGGLARGKLFMKQKEIMETGGLQV